jgi:superfamily I DNA and/or RNA helicase
MPEIMRYLPFAEHIILVGDDFQLPPMFEFTKEDVEGLTCYDEEKFDKLAEMYVQSIFAKTINKARQSNRLIELRENYRSVKTILDAYNVFYEGKLINKREECVGGVHVKFNDKIYNDKNIFMIDVRNGKETIDGTSRYNVEELNATNIILKEIKKSIINPKETSIACIFPYSAQIRNFQKKNIALINEFKILFKSFDIDTVDAFQGKQSDIVILNTVVADATKRSFLSDFRRINVSLSRAKDKLFIFGNSTVLSKIEMNYNGEKRRFLGEILEKIRKNGQRIIYENGKELKYENTDTNKIELA